MADAIQIKFPESDRRAIFAQMERARKELGKSAGSALAFAGFSLAKTLGTSTKTAKPKREIIELPVKRKGGRWGAESGKKPFAVVFDRGARSLARTVYAANKTEVKRMKIVDVRNYGLARASWMWGVKALRGIGAGASFSGVGSIGKAKGQKYIDVSKRLTGDNQFVEFRNKLPYIQEALKGGPGDVTTAMARAGRYMAHIIDGAIKKKMRAA